MARAPLPGRCKTRLEPLLGPEGCAALQTVLLARAVEWARAAAPGRAWVAFDPAEAEAALGVPADVGRFPQEGEDLGARLAHAAERVLAEGSGPLLIAGTDCPALTPAHAAAALGDLGDGCDVSVGPAVDGGYYLLALAGPQPALFALPPDVWGGPHVLRESLQAAGEAGLRIGLLRPERDLDTPADARAMLADPLTPAEIATALRG
jgi:hypothetical protein